MFHISFLVRDKHLAEILHSLQGKAMNISAVPAKMKEATLPLQQSLTTPLQETGRQKRAYTKRAKTRTTKRTKRAPILDVIESLPEEFAAKDLASMGYQRPGIYQAAKKLINQGRLVKSSPGHWKKIPQQHGTTDTPILSERQVS